MQLPRDSTDSQFGPLEKIRFLAKAAAWTGPRLTRGELAVLIVIVNRINAQTGKTFGRQLKIGQNAGESLAQAKRDIKSLVARGVIEITKRGTYTQSNTYAVCWTAFDAAAGGSVTDDTSVTHDTSVTDDTVVVSPMTPGVGSPMTPLSIPLSGFIAPIERNGSHADGDASPGALPSGAGGRPPGKDRYPEFWQAIGRRTSVAAAEARLEKLIAAGADYQEIVDGATRYRAYCDVAGGAKISSDKWLQGEKWRDDWTPPARRAKGKRTSSKHTAGDKPPARIKKQRKSPGPAPAKTVVELAHLKAARDSEPGKALRQHQMRCPQCFGVRRQRYCDEGKHLEQLLFDWVNGNLKRDST